MALRALQGPAGGSAPVGGSGTTNTIPRWTGPTTLGDSAMVQSAAAITVSLPQFALGATGSGTGGGYRVIDDTGTSRFLMGFVGVAGAKDWSLYDLANSAYRVVVVGTGAGAGNVGIGTASPNDRVEVNGNARFTRPNVASQYLQYYGDATYNALVSVSSSKTFALFADANSAGILLQTQAAQPIVLSTNNLERARIDSAGNFGINNASPSSYEAGATQLVVGSGTGAQGVTIAASSDCNLYFATSTSGANKYRGFVRYAVASDALVIGAGSTERARIDSNGNVVVNTAAIATNATNGFLYVPSCAGTPTGTPTTYTGRVPIVVDTTNNKLYFYSGGAWRDAGP